MRHALVIHHDPDTALGCLDRILRERGFGIVHHNVGTSLDDPRGSTVFPDLSGPHPDLIIVMGSRWSLTDAATDHWVHPELDLLRRADDLDIPVFGVCFGAQLLAAAHGGVVGFAVPTRDRVAHRRARRTCDDESSRETAAHAAAMAELRAAIGDRTWFEWHGDRFDLPPGATPLAVTEVGPQAFALRRNLGVQFHPEVDSDVLDLWLRHDRRHLDELGVDVDALIERTRAESDRAAVAAGVLFDSWWRSVG